jgi:mannitol/fructose-specific phosphotransferase system IIA component (Ntr-type)
MNLSAYLSLEAIEPSLQSQSRREVLAELAELIKKSGGVPGDTDLVTILENREELGSTAVGSGSAIPHVRLKNLKNIRVAVGKSRGGVDFNAPDGKPVHLFFLLVAPESATGDHLKALARISRLLRREDARRALVQAVDGSEIMKIIVQKDEKDT